MFNATSQGYRKQTRMLAATVFSLVLCLITQNAYAGYFHYMGGHKNSIIVWRDQVYMAKVDIIYDGVFVCLCHAGGELHLARRTHMNEPPLRYKPLGFNRNSITELTR